MKDYTDLGHRLVKASENLKEALGESLATASQLELNLGSLNLGIRCSIEVPRGATPFRFGYSRNKESKRWEFYVQAYDGMQYPLREAPIELQIQACKNFPRLLEHMHVQAQHAISATKKAIEKATIYANVMKEDTTGE